jgi:hypothetical protein
VKRQNGVKIYMENTTKIFGILLIVSLLLGIISVGAIYTGNIKGIKGDKGDPGIIGIPGIHGTNGTYPAHQWNGTNIRFQLSNGTWGNWTNIKGDDGSSTTGSPGPQGPAGSQGPQGPAGKDGSPNLPPVVTSKSPNGCIGIDDDWIFSITVNDPEGDLMNVEFFLYVETEWFEDTPIYWLPFAIGNHVWIPILNEVGHNGTYSFNATTIKNYINWDVVEIPECMELKWRYDVTDRVVSEEPIYSPSCYLDWIGLSVYNCYDGYNNFTIYVDNILVYTWNSTWSGWMDFESIDISEAHILCCCDYHTIKIVATSEQGECYNPCGQIGVDCIYLGTDKGYTDYVNIGDSSSESGHNLQGWGPAPTCCDYELETGQTIRTVWSPTEAEPVGNWASLRMMCYCNGCI